MVYDYATTPVHDSRAGRVAIIRQKPGEYRDFTGLPYVCKTIHKEYTTRISLNTKVTIRAEDIEQFIDVFYPTKGGKLKAADLRVIYTVYGKIGSLDGFSTDSKAVQSPELNLVPLLKLPQRLSEVQISFLCYIWHEIADKPVYWDVMTKDFNNILGTQPMQGPVLLDQPPLPHAPPLITRYFAARTHCELSIAPRWPQPDSTSPCPAMVLNIRFRAQSNMDFPFSGARDRPVRRTLVQTLWGVDKTIKTTSLGSSGNMMAIRMFLCRIQLCSSKFSGWYVRFEPIFSEPPQEWVDKLPGKTLTGSRDMGLLSKTVAGVED